MKKILLTNLIILLSSTSVLAGGVDAKLGGSLTFETGARSKKQNTNISNLNKTVAFYTQAKVAAQISKKLENGLSYGGVLGIKTDTTNDSRFSKDNLDRSYLFVQCEQIGRVELGSNYKASEMLKIDARNVAAGSGGATGNWFRFSGITLNPLDFAIFEPSVLKYNQNQVENWRNISYYSPNFEGLQFGASYTPDASNRGDLASLQTNTGGNRLGKNLISLGLNYSNQFDQVKLAGSITSDFGKTVTLPPATTPQYTKLRSVALGGSIAYQHFTLVGSYGNKGNSATKIGDPNRKGAYYTAGIAYDQGPIITSLTYLKAKSNNQRFQLASLGFDYRLAEGLTPYLEATWFKNKDLGKVTPNYSSKGTVFIGGIKLVL